eukprot:64144-Chlamydomonas_euryale.AAC.1
MSSLPAPAATATTRAAHARTAGAVSSTASSCSSAGRTCANDGGDTRSAPSTALGTSSERARATAARASRP